MTRPRVRIGTLMLLVAIVALPLAFLAARVRSARTEADMARRAADLRERTVRAQATQLIKAVPPAR